MAVSAAAEVFAGLGLFFVGINVLSDHLKSFGKPYISKIIKALVNNRYTAIVSGIIAGAVTNSGKAVTFSLTGLISSGMLKVRNAFPIILGASLGSSFLVLYVSVDFLLMQLIMLGAAGVMFQFFDMKSPRINLIAGALLGLGLIFYGLDMLKRGAAPAKESELFVTFMLNTKDYWVSALVVGTVAAFVTQSGSSLSIIVISLVAGGLLDMNQSIMFVYGTNIGSGFATATLSVGMVGTPRQLVFFHALVKIIGSFILVPLLYVEVYMGVPAVKAFAASLATGEGQQIGIIYLLYEVVSGVVLLLTLPFFEKLFAVYWPPSDHEKLSRIKYLKQFSISAVENSTELIRKEINRVMKRCPMYLNNFQFDATRAERVDEKVLHEANQVIQEEIQSRITDLLKLNLSKSQTQKLLILHSMQELVMSLENNLLAFSKSLHGGKQPPSKALATNLVEALNMMLFAVADCVQESDPYDTNYLVLMTEHRESTIERLKQKYLLTLSRDDSSAKKAVIELTAAYEKVIWSLNKIARTLAKDITHKKNLILETRDPQASAGYR